MSLKGWDRVSLKFTTTPLLNESCDWLNLQFWGTLPPLFARFCRAIVMGFEDIVRVLHGKGSVSYEQW